MYLQTATYTLLLFPVLEAMLVFCEFAMSLLAVDEGDAEHAGYHVLGTSHSVGVGRTSF